MTTQPSPERDPQQTAEKMRILVIEDDDKVAGFLEQGLREEEFDVGRGRDGDEAVVKALQEDFDLILLDYMLPKRSGPQVAKTIREAGRSTPILMLTARDAPDDIQLCLDSGANAYLTKPFRFADLLAQIHRLARRSAEG
jgi:DNA-binding response OmpR family regulator